MKTHFPNDYNFMPKTYIYPIDKEKIKKKFSKYKLKLRDLWIVKPTNLFLGLVFIFLNL